MKSFWGNAGNFNLRGKRVKRLGCGCCTILDLRPKVAAEEARREVAAALTGQARERNDRSSGSWLPKLPPTTTRQVSVTGPDANISSNDCQG